MSQEHATALVPESIKEIPELHSTATPAGQLSTRTRAASGGAASRAPAGFAMSEIAVRAGLAPKQAAAENQRPRSNRER
jgi:hypothetical protein